MISIIFLKTSKSMREKKLQKALSNFELDFRVQFCTVNEKQIFINISAIDLIFINQNTTTTTYPPLH